jgi:3-methylcrotonyl-CoA carboxylase alpha subunit
VRIVVRDGATEHLVTLHDDEADEPDVTTVKSGDRWFVWLEGAPYEFEVGPAPRSLGASAAHLDAPLPGQVLAVRIASGDHVAKGAELVVIEAMKMEHAIKAPADGTVSAVLCAAGDQVERAQRLVEFEPDADA